jgi:hypothetical protein
MHEYVCDNCDNYFELSWRSTDPVRCPECLKYEAYADEPDYTEEEWYACGSYGRDYE